MVFGISKIHTNADFTFSNNKIVLWEFIDLTFLKKFAILLASKRVSHYH